MYQKAVLFNDIETMNKILKIHAPFKIKNIGRKVRNFDQKTWDNAKNEIIYKGNLFKFSQNNKLCQKLLKQGTLF